MNFATKSSGCGSAVGDDEPMMPHNNVYTRLGVSKIHGVGVFAIKDIPKGTYPFGKDYFVVNPDAYMTVNKNDLPDNPSLRKLYDDFCVIKGDTYWCPDNFNNMNTSYYLNEDKISPNMACDDNDEFYALRDIAAGEELTVDYETYSDYPEEV